MHALHLLLSTSREVSTETRNWNTFQLRRRNDVHITRRITGAKRKWWGKGNAERRKEQRNGWNEVGKWLQLNQKIYHEYATSETVPRTFLFFRICLAKIKILLTFASLTASVFWCAKGHQCEQGFFFFPFLVLRERTAIIDRSIRFVCAWVNKKVGTKQLLYLCNI